MNTKTKRTAALVIAAAIAAIAAPMTVTTVAASSLATTTAQSRGTAVAFPWVFENGTDTARETAVSTAVEIGRKAGYDMVQTDHATDSWLNLYDTHPTIDDLPNLAKIAAFGNSEGANRVLYGTVSWHTRSIWVVDGPKTISTATVNVYVMNPKTGTILYSRKGIMGRSDEQALALKMVADVLFTPLVGAVSGGPATPQEQRAVQVALARAYHPWVRESNGGSR